MVRLIVILAYLFLHNDGLCQKLYPLLENDITYCYHCDNELNIEFVDRVWEYENEIYTKIKWNDSFFELFKLTDTTYHFRKYREDDLIEKGDILLRRDNIVFKDTLYVHYYNSYEEYFVVYGFAKPIKINRWEIMEGLNTKSNGKFDESNNKVGNWIYKTCDTTLVKNHNNYIFYYIKPQPEIVKRNIDWLFNRFYSKIWKSDLKPIEGLIHHIDHSYTTADEWNVAHNKNFYKLVIEFERNGDVYLEVREGEKVKFSETLKWKIDDYQSIEFSNKNNVFKNLEIKQFGKRIISLVKL